MAVAHYGYLILKMPSPNGVLKIRGDRDVGVCALEKLQALAAARTIELVSARLGLSTPRATPRHPREDHPGRDRGWTYYP
jgi:hypothetical protein